MIRLPVNDSCIMRDSPAASVWAAPADLRPFLL